MPTVGFIGILGGSGSGKSTLLALLSLLEEPSEGEIRFLGRKLSAFSKREREDYRSLHFGYLFQHFNLIEEKSALLNVELPLMLRGEKESEAEGKAKRLFERFRLAEIEERTVALLSGGEKQRVALLRSLAGEAEILFADEPSGALDPENERLVFSALRELAKDHLLIVVSHNARLLEKSADRILVLEAGRLLEERGEIAALEKPLPLKRRGHHLDWLPLFFWKNYRANRKRNLLSLSASVLCYLSLLFVAGFYLGSQRSLQEQGNRSLDYLHCSLAKKETFPIEGSPLSLSQQTRPTYSEAERLLSAIDGVSFHPDYSYFFPRYGAYSLNGEKEEGASFLPLLDLSLRNRSLSFPCEGKVPEGNSLDEVVVNDCFASLFPESPLGKSITLTLQSVVEENGVEDEISFPLRFLVKAVAKEFSFLATPKIYYSYSAFAALIHETSLPKISEKRGKEITLEDFLEDESGDGEYSSYAYEVFAHDEAAGDALKSFSSSLKEQASSYALTSEVYEIASAFASLTSAFSESLLPFLAIVFLGVAFIVSSLSYASFLQRKKEAAILWALGARNSEIDALYLLESLANSFLGAAFSLLLILPLEKGASWLLEEKFGIANLVAVPLFGEGNHPWLFEFLLGVLSLVFALLGTLLPLFSMHQRSLLEELRDE